MQYLIIHSSSPAALLVNNSVRVICTYTQTKLSYTVRKRPMYVYIKSIAMAVLRGYYQQVLAGDQRFQVRCIWPQMGLVNLLGCCPLPSYTAFPIIVKTIPMRLPR